MTNMLHSAVLKCLIEESGRGSAWVSVHEGNSEFYAEIVSYDTCTALDPINHKVPLSVTGQSPADAFSKLEILLQQWY